MTSVLRNRGSRGGFSSAVHANALSALLFDGSCIVIDILSQVREGLWLMWENHSFDKFSPALLSFQLQF